MKRTLITGAGRGLGLEFVRQTVERGDRVFAAVRRPNAASALNQWAAEKAEQLTVIPLDVTDPRGLAASVGMVRQHVDGLDILINNAGVNAESAPFGTPAQTTRLGVLEEKAMMGIFAVNAIAPIMVAQRYLDLLRGGDGAVIINLSSGDSSISGKRTGGNYGYDASKTALNMLTRTLAFDVLDDGIVAVTMNPGWVKTDMGGSHAELETTESVAGMLKVADRLTGNDAGRFLNWAGEEVDW